MTDFELWWEEGEQPMFPSLENPLRSQDQCLGCWVIISRLSLFCEKSPVVFL